MLLLGLLVELSVTTMLPKAARVLKKIIQIQIIFLKILGLNYAKYIIHPVDNYNVVNSVENIWLKKLKSIL